MGLVDDQNVSPPSSTVTLASLSLSDSSTGEIDHAPPQQPIFPIEIVEEIIIRLPVKFLSQLRCVCKSWNALISDPKFARRHIRRFNRPILIVHTLEHPNPPFPETHFWSYPFPSVLKPVTTGGTEIDFPPFSSYPGGFWTIGSCAGIICFYNYGPGSDSFIFWNPSIRKFWELKALETPLLEGCDGHTFCRHGFGYDHLSDSFKLVVIVYSELRAGGYKNQIMLHTLGSNSWRRIEDYPIRGDGKFLSGALHWLTENDDCIIALDLGKESYQKLLVPDFGIELTMLSVDVMRDWLCLLANNSDVWVMKEYGNSDSWTKLFSFPIDSWEGWWPKSLCVLEDDESLFLNVSSQNLDSYNYKSGTVRSSTLEYKPGLIKYTHFEIENIHVEIESLISPFPQN